MREWRQTHKLEGLARFKDISRSVANVNQKRGVLVPEICEACGNPDAEKHHDDYTAPLTVNWLCRECHLQWHRYLKVRAA
jgi:hypothetical protein